MKDLSQLMKQGEASRQDFDEYSHNYNVIWNACLQIFHGSQLFHGKHDDLHSYVIYLPGYVQNLLGALFVTIERIVECNPSLLSYLINCLYMILFNGEKQPKTLFELIDGYLPLFPYSYKFIKRVGRAPKHQSNLWEDALSCKDISPSTEVISTNDSSSQNINKTNTNSSLDTSIEIIDVTNDIKDTNIKARDTPVVVNEKKDKSPVIITSTRGNSSEKKMNSIEESKNSHVSTTLVQSFDDNKDNEKISKRLSVSFKEEISQTTEFNISKPILRFNNKQSNHDSEFIQTIDLDYGSDLEKDEENTLISTLSQPSKSLDITLIQEKSSNSNSNSNIQLIHKPKPIITSTVNKIRSSISSFQDDYDSESSETSQEKIILIKQKSQRESKSHLVNQSIESERWLSESGEFSFSDNELEDIESIDIPDHVSSKSDSHVIISSTSKVEDVNVNEHYKEKSSPSSSSANSSSLDLFQKLQPTRSSSTSTETTIESLPKNSSQSIDGFTNSFYLSETSNEDDSFYDLNQLDHRQQSSQINKPSTSRALLRKDSMSTSQSVMVPIQKQVNLSSQTSVESSLTIAVDSSVTKEKVSGNSVRFQENIETIPLNDSTPHTMIHKTPSPTSLSSNDDKASNVIESSFGLPPLSPSSKTIAIRDYLLDDLSYDTTTINSSSPKLLATFMKTLLPYSSQSKVILESWLEKKSKRTLMWNKKYYVLSSSTYSISSNGLKPYCVLKVYKRVVETSWGIVPIELLHVIDIVTIDEVKLLNIKSGREFEISLRSSSSSFIPTSILNTSNHDNVKNTSSINSFMNTFRTTSQASASDNGSINSNSDYKVDKDITMTMRAIDSEVSYHHTCIFYI